MKRLSSYLIATILICYLVALAYGVWDTIDFSNRCQAKQGQVVTIDRTPTCVKSAVIIDMGKP